MYTVLCDCESTINNRPLTYLTEGDENLRPLTPAMFLHEINNQEEIYDLDTIDSKSLNRRLKYIQSLREQLRTRFRKEYLSELVQHKNAGKFSDLKINDIVLVETDGTKRVNWPLGRIIEIFKGRDGNYRVAKVKVSTGVLIRPIQRLYQLEIRGDELDKLNVTDTRSVVEPISSKFIKMKEAINRVSSRGRKLVKPVKLDL